MCRRGALNDSFHPIAESHYSYNLHVCCDVQPFFSVCFLPGGDGEQGHVSEHVRGERERLRVRGGVRRTQLVQTQPV